MARKTFNYTHGDTGTEPTSALDFAKNERPKAGNFDWYWYNAIEAIKDHANAFAEIDSDDDGVVDEADTLAAGGNLKGDLNTTDGETIWDESGGYIPQAQLQNNSVSVSAGDGLKGGGSVSLGGSTTINVEPANFAGAGLQDDGADDLELVNDTVTVAGNGVSLGGSTAISHGDLSDAPASAHHAKYTDSEAVTAVNNETALNVDISGDADTLDGKEYSDIETWVNNNADVPNADHADTAGDADSVDGIDASGLAKRGVGVEHDVYASESDVPSSITKGEVVLIDGDGLYVEQ